MRRRKLWLCALATALGSFLPGRGFCEDVVDESGFDSRPAARFVASPRREVDEAFTQPRPAVQLAANNLWRADKLSSLAPEPLEGDAAPMPSAPPVGSCDCASASCCGPTCSLIASVEATFFWPQFHRNFLSATYFNPNTNAPQNVSSTTALGSTDGSLMVGPRITLGVQGDCWGLVGRYWNGTSWATGFAPSNPFSTGAGIVNFDGFKAYTADLELQRRFCLGAWSGYGAFGVRYASVNNDRSLNVTTFGGLPGAAGDTVTTSFASQQFNGTGITFGFWAIRPLCCDSPFKVFLANRYSFLWGTSEAAAQTSALAGLAATATNVALASSTNGSLFIGELQLGLQWDAQLQCFPGRAFVRGAFEYQYWDAANNTVSARANSFANAGTAGSTASVSAGDMLFSLVGLNLGAGIMY
jgi:hypothetical protein